MADPLYATDAAAEPNVKVVGVFPEDSHPPIVYPIALTANAKDPDVVAFLTFLRSPAARPAFEKQGFTVLRANQKMKILMSLTGPIIYNCLFSVP